MHLKEIRLRNFRNYIDENIKFHPKINWIFGDNAQGKTNLVEAIYLLMKGISFRGNKEDWLKFQENHCYIQGIFEEKGREFEVELNLSQNENKKISINKEIIKNKSDILKLFHCVIFSPEDLRLVKDGPYLRRKYIDYFIQSAMPEYEKIIKIYDRILLQRNNLLKYNQKSFYFKEQIRVLNHQFLEVGAEVLFLRKKYTDILNALAKNIHRQLTWNKEDLLIIYDSPFIFLNSKQALSKEEIRENFIQAMKESFLADREKQVTTIGPHRDDLKIIINKMDIRYYASQGQQRTAILSLKLSEMKLIENTFYRKPILLLDDIFSELDENRQEYLLQTMGDGQIFITTINQWTEQNITSPSSAPRPAGTCATPSWGPATH